MNQRPDLRSRLIYNAKMVGITLACHVLLAAFLYALFRLGVIQIHRVPDELIGGVAATG
jgi:hypothetical protein